MSAMVSIRLKPEVNSRLDRLVEQTGRSRSWLVSRAIEDYVTLNVWQVPKILEGIASAERDDFATEEEMRRIRGKFSREAI